MIINGKIPLKTGRFTTKCEKNSHVSRLCHSVDYIKHARVYTSEVIMKIGDFSLLLRSLQITNIH